MVVRDLIAQLETYPQDAPVVMAYNSNTGRSDDIAVYIEADKVVIDADGWLEEVGC